MGFLFVAALVWAAVAGSGGLVIGQAFRPFSRRLRLGVYLGLLCLAPLSYAWHYDNALAYAVGFGVHGPDIPVGRYPGLIRFERTTPWILLAVQAAAVLASLRAPILGTALPGALFLAYWGPLGWLAENPPGVILDNKPNIWLAVVNFGATFGLLGYVAAAFPRTGRPRGGGA